MLLMINCHLIFTEQGLGAGLASSKGHEIMECGLKKLTNSTPNWNTVGPKVSGIQSLNTRIKQEPNDFLFGISSSDQKPAVPGNPGASYDDWLPIHFTATFKDDDLCNRQGVVILLPSGVTHTDDINVMVESEGMILKVSVAVPQHITDPVEFLLFKNQPAYQRLMQNGDGTRNMHFTK